MPERIEISVIPQDLRHEETIVQIAEALDDLDFAVSHIFHSINERICENNNRLGIIRTRAVKLQRQLDYLKTNLNLKAVKMYSAAKYPANSTYKEYKLAINPKFRKEIASNKIYKSPVPISDKYDSLLATGSKVENGQYASNLNMQEKLQFYYIKSKPTKNNKLYEVEKDRSRQNISSIDSLLLFNKKNSENPVNLQSVQNEDRNQIEDAPDSILQPWHSSEIESPSNYLYAPTLGEVPQMNVPLTLPDLPGIVDDERFIFDLNLQSPIAPSSTVATPTIYKDPPALENIVQETNKRQANETETPKVEILPKLASTLPCISIPLSSESKIESLLKPSCSVTSITNSSVTPSPPPPPPPPLPPFLPQEEEKKPVKKLITVKITQSDDRSNLMAAIRDAGGIGRAKLRHTTPVEKKKDRWSSASVGGDLMADLYATLSLRRKGIAGSTVNTLARLSSMIPPPPKPNESSASDKNSATSECESQDDDGWEE